MTAIHRQGGAGDETARLGGQKQQRAIKLAFAAQTAEGNAVDQRLTGGRGEEFSIEWGFDIARAQRIDPDAIARPFQRQRPRHLDHSRFAGGIGRHRARDPQPGNRGDIDDAAWGSGGAQTAGGGLRHQKAAAQIGGDHLVKGFGGHVDRRATTGDSCVVDHDVKALGGEQRLDAGGITDIKRHRCGAVALGAQTRDLFGQFLGAARAQCHFGPGFGQYGGEMRAQPARRPGDQCGLAAQMQFHRCPRVAPHAPPCPGCPPQRDTRDSQARPSGNQGSKLERVIKIFSKKRLLLWANRAQIFVKGEIFTFVCRTRQIALEITGR